MRAAGSACLVNPAWGEWSAPVEFGKNKSLLWAALPPAMSCLPHTLPGTYGHTELANVLLHTTLQRRVGSLNRPLNILTLEIILQITRLQL